MKETKHFSVEIVRIKYNDIPRGGLHFSLDLPIDLTDEQIKEKALERANRICDNMAEKVVDVIITPK